jgi:DNA-binding transcriptional MerR regulator
VQQAASGELLGAFAQAHEHLALVQGEIAQAEGAAAFLERWAQGIVTTAAAPPLHISQAARLLGVTTDILRNWERNGLLTVPRDPENGYRLYGAAEIDRLRVIRTLLRAGYSTMAVLRMMLQLDRGQRSGLREVLDTPRPDEDILYVTDRWLSALSNQERLAREILAQLEAMIQKQQA